MFARTALSSPTSSELLSSRPNSYSAKAGTHISSGLRRPCCTLSLKCSIASSVLAIVSRMAASNRNIHHLKINVSSGGDDASENKPLPTFHHLKTVLS
ncbi:hypothetical protein E2C01_026406 [Portunus trituberculatus]|uniref:Uncharacterized protein n=1 Tax=Portunus trituberculatus TaxID=210409 RepID=A0A5B7EIG9_PORTR|nr:hypothetical protein [Portunus trituberculatus]